MIMHTLQSNHFFEQLRHEIDEEEVAGLTGTLIHINLFLVLINDCFNMLGPVP
jgi:hypothetical protein